MGNAESQPVRNTDKRTARRDHAHKFKGAITMYRQEHGGAPPGVGDLERNPLIHDPGDALRVAVRRRPFFKHELDQGEFDVVSCETRKITVHDCRLYPDCRRMYVEHKSFRFDRVYNEQADSLEVYNESVSPLVRRATIESRASTVLMYGQTGSGKTFTMRAIFAAAAEDIFRWIDRSRGDYVTICFAELGGSGARDMLANGNGIQMLTDAVSGACSRVYTSSSAIGAPEVSVKVLPLSSEMRAAKDVTPASTCLRHGISHMTTDAL